MRVEITDARTGRITVEERAERGYTRTVDGTVVESRALTADETALVQAERESAHRIDIEEQIAILAQLLIAPALTTMTAADRARVAPLFPPWRPGERVSAGEVREFGGEVVRAARAHTTRIDGTPDLAPELWTRYRETGGGRIEPGIVTVRNPR